MKINPRSISLEKNRKVYGNYQVFSPDDILMFRCDEKKANWYINRDLAESINDFSIRLKFEPNGLGNHEKDLSDMINQCVVCGVDEFLTKHHVVPQCYRKFLPLEIKSHNSHDVLLLCIDCHEEYEIHADELKKSISIEYDAPLNGLVIGDVNNIKYMKMASVLIKEDSNIPILKINDIKNKIKEFFGFKRLTKNKINEVSSIKMSNKVTHGEIVMNQVFDIQSFVEMWRNHFIEKMDCKYLPEKWSIKTKV